MQKSLLTCATLSDRPPISKRIRTSAECDEFGAIIDDSEFQFRATKYAARRRITVLFDDPLGHGTDGHVWNTSERTAVKVFERQKNYALERDCYLRLRDANVSIIAGFNVPCLYEYDDELWIVEMSVVSPPFLLDFGKVYLDNPPDYSPEVMEDDEENRRELFEDHWEEVEELLWRLQLLGIYYVDAKPGNIRFQ